MFLRLKEEECVFDLVRCLPSRFEGPARFFVPGISHRYTAHRASLSAGRYHIEMVLFAGICKDVAGSF